MVLRVRHWRFSIRESRLLVAVGSDSYSSLESDVNMWYDHEMIPVEGCVVNWERQIQINPETGEQFDFAGHKIFDNDLGAAETVADSTKEESHDTEKVPIPSADIPVADVDADKWLLPDATDNGSTEHLSDV